MPLVVETLGDPDARAEWTRTWHHRELAVWLVDYRTRHGLTQAELADMIGISQPGVSQIERAMFVTTIPTLQAIAESLGVSITVTLERDCNSIDFQEVKERK